MIVASFVVGNTKNAFFFVRCDSVRSTPGGCFPQTPLPATNRLHDCTRAVLRNLFRRPCALLYERAGLRSVAPRVIPKSCPRRRLRRLAPCGALGTFWKPCAPGLPCGLRRTHPLANCIFYITWRTVLTTSAGAISSYKYKSPSPVLQPPPRNPREFPIRSDTTP